MEDLTLIPGRWCKPPPGYKKLNIDGGFRDAQGSFGSVLRDDEGNWIWGFNGSNNANDALHAKIISLKRGLEALVEKNVGRTIIETDSSNKVNLIHGTIDEDHPRFGLIMECKNMIGLLSYTFVVLAIVILVRMCWLNQDKLIANNLFVGRVDVILPTVREALLNDICKVNNFE